MKYLYCKLSDFAKAEYEAEYSSLSPERRARIDRIKKNADKQRSLAGVMMIKKLLKEDFGISNPEIKYTEKGAPYLFEHSIFISIAHSEEGIAVVADESPVGIDIEKIRDIDLALCKKTCTEMEDEYVLSGLNEWEKVCVFWRSGQPRKPISKSREQVLQILNRSAFSTLSESL